MGISLAKFSDKESDARMELWEDLKGRLVIDMQTKDTSLTFQLTKTEEVKLFATLEVRIDQMTENFLHPHFAAQIVDQYKRDQRFALTWVACFGLIALVIFGAIGIYIWLIN